jgi:hypothetical protein
VFKFMSLIALCALASCVAQDKRENSLREHVSIVVDGKSDVAIRDAGGRGDSIANGMVVHGIPGKRKLKALVIYNEGENFSVGLNLGLALFSANLAMWAMIEDMVECGAIETAFGVERLDPAQRIHSAKHRGQTGVHKHVWTDEGASRVDIGIRQHGMKQPAHLCRGVVNHHAYARAKRVRN